MYLNTLSGNEVAVGALDLEAFRSELRGDVILPDEAGYGGARSLWNGMIDKRPGMIVRCRGAADVLRTVTFARERDARLGVRGGGHNVSGNALSDGGVVIDLSAMRGARVDPRRGTVRIAGGARLGDVDHETCALGLATPSGVVSETGYGGLALHGGMGWQVRLHGLACDNLVSADVVTAGGQLVTADAEHHPDLFWGLRGGGGNFGVVTSFEARLHPMPPRVLLSAGVVPLERAATVLRLVRDTLPEAPPELGVVGALWTAPDDPRVPRQVVGEHALVLLACYVGDPDEGERALRPLREIAAPVADLGGPMSWPDVQRFLDADYPDGRRYYWKSTQVRTLPDDLIDAVVAHTAARPSPLSSVDVWPLGGAFARVGANDTAFGRRDVTFVVNYEANWERAADDAANVEWARASLAEAEARSEARTYLNFAGLAEEGEALVRGALGDYDRLRRVKATYDPDNLFRENFNIRPADLSAA